MYLLVERLVEEDDTADGLRHGLLVGGEQQLPKHAPVHKNIEAGKRIFPRMGIRFYRYDHLARFFFYPQPPRPWAQF